MLSLKGEKNGNLGCNQKTERAAIAFYYPCSLDLCCVLHIFLKLPYSAMAQEQLHSSFLHEKPSLKRYVQD